MAGFGEQVPEQVPETRGLTAGSRPHAGECIPGGAADEHALSDLASFTMSADGRITSWGAAARRLFGRTGEQAVGSPVTDLLAAGHENALSGALAAARAGESWVGSVAVAGPDGRRAVAIRWDPLEGTHRPPQVAVVARQFAPVPEALLDAHARLGASLDLAETVRQVLELSIPRFADAGAVYLLEQLVAGGRDEAVGTGGEAVFRRLAIHTTDGSHRRWEDALPDEEVVVFPRSTPMAKAAAGGRPVLFDQPDAGMRERASRYAGGDILSRYASFLVTPLTARGEVAGLLLLARAAGAPVFGAPEISAAEGLAARAGVCVDNARLYTQERRTAEALKRGLLPHRMASPAGLDVAHRYQPAGDQAIGGDWFDVIALPGGRATVTVGDAMGHGPEAAAVMAQLRAATHALADLGLSPDALLHRLNRMAMTVSDAVFATCVCAIIDPGSGSCLLSRAGHLLPLLALPGGSCGVVGMPAGLPLGLGEAEFSTVEISLPPGAILALYTDGLVENRGRTLDHGVETLRAAVAGIRGPLPAACDSIVSSLCQHGEDDTTLVLIRMPGP